MEEWIDILKERLEGAEVPSTQEDWAAFEAKYLSGRRRRRVIPLVASLVTVAAAAAVALFMLNRPAAEEPVQPDSVLPIVAESETEESIEVPEDTIKIILISSAISPITLTPSVEASADNDSIDQAEPEITKPKEEENAPEESIATDKVPAGDSEFQYFETPERPGSPYRRRIRLSSNIGGSANSLSADTRLSLGRLLGGNGGIFPNDGEDPASVTPATADHHFPLAFGLDVSYPLTPRLSLTSGIELSIYKSRFLIPTLSSPQVEQKVYYLGIPLRLDWTVWQGERFSSWIGAGGKVDRSVYAMFGNKKVKDDAFNWSALANAGLRYDIVDNVGIYLAPEASWHFKPENPNLLTYRTENPLTFSVKAGLYFSF